MYSVLIFFIDIYYSICFFSYHLYYLIDLLYILFYIHCVCADIYHHIVKIYILNERSSIS